MKNQVIFFDDTFLGKVVSHIGKYITLFGTFLIIMGFYMSSSDDKMISLWLWSVGFVAVLIGMTSQIMMDSMYIVEKSKQLDSDKS